MVVVTVIVPTYNYGHFIAECLQSLCKQSFQDWECLVIDDGSNDSTEEVVKSFIQKDARISYYFKPNKGPNAARNKGLEIASGKFIQLLDADDLLEPGKIQLHCDWLNSNEDTDIVYSHHRVFTSSSGELTWLNEFQTPRSSGSGLDMGLELLKGPFTINSAMVRREVFDKVGSFDESFRFNEDWMFWLRCLNAGCRFDFVDRPDSRALVRRHESNATLDQWNIFYFRTKMREAFDQYTSIEELKSYNQQLLSQDIDFLMNLAIDALKESYLNGNRRIWKILAIKLNLRFLAYGLLGLLNMNGPLSSLRSKSFKSKG